MFICAFCHKSSRHGESMRRVVTASEPIEYPIREGAYPPRGEEIKRRPDNGGVGTRIMQEKPMCPRCTEAAIREMGFVPVGNVNS